MKKQIKNYLKIGFFLLGIAFTTTSCEKEDESQDNQLFLLSQKQELKLEFIQKNFSLKNCKDDYFKSNLQIKWKEYSAFINIDSTISYEFSTSLNSKISSVNNKYHFYTQYKLQATIDNSNNVSYRILKYLSNNKQSLKKIDYNSLNDFSGTISHFNLDGKSLKIEAFNKGEFIQEFKNSSNKGNVSAIEAPIEPGTWVPIIVERWTDWYKNSLGGNIIFFYTKSSNKTVTIEYLYIETGGSGYLNTTYHSHTDAPHGSGTYPDPDIDNHVEEILIDSSFENSKANCAYKLLMDNVEFNKILDSLIPKDSQYSVIFKVGDIEGTATGSTDANTDPNKTDITITIDDFHAENSSIISVALSILHESVHARLIEKVKSLGGLSKLSEFAYLDSEMEQLAAYYNKYDGEHNPAHHDFIWDNYVDKLANGVEEFHKSFPEDYIKFHNYMIGTDGYNKDTFYKLAAKGSLQETSYFKALDSTNQKIISNMASKLKDLAKKITDQINCK